MSKEKKSTIEFNFLQITALEQPELGLFTNSFIYHDDDYFHKNIGSLFGVIQVTDHSKNSEYLPNLLTSIIKKAFYSNDHKSTEENFEFALKKAGLALADLAESDITEWRSNLHAIVGVFDGTTLLFAQVGDATTFLSRDNKLITLSEQGSKTPTHPIKTFQDIITGEIKIGDKLILATPMLHDIFGNSDISRLLKTFSSNEFNDIFFKTLKKEGSNISAISVDITKKKINDYSKSSALDDADISIKKLTKNKNFLGETIKTETAATTPKKDTKKITPSSKTTSKKTSTSSSHTKKVSKKITPAKKKEIKKEKITKKVLNKKKKSIKIKVLKKLTSKKKATIKKTPPKTKIKSTSSSIKKPVKLNSPKLKKVGEKLNDLTSPKTAEKVELSPFEEVPEIYIKSDDIEKRAKKPSSKKLQKFFHPKKKSTNNSSQSSTILKSTLSPRKAKSLPIKEKFPTSLQKKNTSNTIALLRDKSKLFTMTLCKKATTQLTKLLPSKTCTPSKHLKETSVITQNTTFNIQKLLPFIHKNKIYLLAFVVIFVIFVLLIAMKGKKEGEKSLNALKMSAIPTETKKELLIEDKDVSRTLLSLPSAISILTGNATLLIAYTEEEKLYQINKQTNKIKPLKIQSGIDISSITHIGYISSLNLFLLSSNTKTISYSPKTEKFYTNKLTLPKNFKLAGQDTFLDYLYLLNGTTGQIYRYPREVGGFGDGKAWLKELLPNQNSSIVGMAIDEDIRIAYSDGMVNKYFGGKLKNTKKIKLSSLDYIYTNKSLKNYYLLDKTNSEILQVSKRDDSVIARYQNSNIKHTTTLTANEKDNLIYIFNDKEIFSLKLHQ